MAEPERNLDDAAVGPVPRGYDELVEASRRLGFGMPSDRQTGALLRALAVSKPGGRFLELGTGTGLGACWLLDGMDAASTLVSVEKNDEWLTLARTHLMDPRAQFVLADGREFLERTAAESFDFIYADTWPGKFTGFDHTLRILRPHGLVVMDDLLPQPNWPMDHAPKVARLLEEIDRLPREKYAVLKMGWYTGHIVVAKRGR